MVRVWKGLIMESIRYSKIARSRSNASSMWVRLPATDNASWYGNVVRQVDLAPQSPTKLRIPLFMKSSNLFPALPIFFLRNRWSRPVAIPFHIRSDKPFPKHITTMTAIWIYKLIFNKGDISKNTLSKMESIRAAVPTKWVRPMCPSSHCQEEQGSTHCGAFGATSHSQNWEETGSRP